MEILIALGALLLSYFIGSIPFGLVIVKLATGRDIRTVESGRTGGTNAMRAAGFFAGAGTAILDLFKGIGAVWLARWILPGNVWLEICAPLAAVLGHNYSIFLMERNAQGKLRLRGGAGGAPTTGGAVGLWWPSFFIIFPIGMGFLFGVGFASLATLSIGISTTLVFVFRYLNGDSPWQYILYGVAATILLAISLRPNIRRLLNGSERLVGWRARRKARLAEQNKSKNYSSSYSSSSS
jgi:glycerol-3-phosphate acyltransferase PlsY